MTIKFADQHVREARQRIVALDRELAQLPKAFLALPADDPIVKELRAENVRLPTSATGPIGSCWNCSSSTRTPREEMGSA